MTRYQPIFTHFANHLSSHPQINPTGQALFMQITLRADPYTAIFQSNPATLATLINDTHERTRKQLRILKATGFITYSETNRPGIRPYFVHGYVLRNPRESSKTYITRTQDEIAWNMSINPRNPTLIPTLCPTLAKEYLLCGKLSLESAQKLATSVLMRHPGSWQRMFFSDFAVENSDKTELPGSEIPNVFIKPRPTYS